MRSVVQRVKGASVTVMNEKVSSIGKGLLVLLAVGQEDGPEDIKWMADKLTGLRIFEDEASKMNRSVLDVGGEILLVSQFTLYGDCRRGKRPSFSAAASPEEARELFNQSAETIRGYGIEVKTGVFQADMEVALVNDGPVTILLDSKKTF